MLKRFVIKPVVNKGKLRLKTVLAIMRSLAEGGSDRGPNNLSRQPWPRDWRKRPQPQIS